MNKPVYILGTGLSHNGSACLLKDGQVLIAIEKERITRIKHDGGNDTDAVKYCLDGAGITLHDLSLIVQCANFEKEEIAITHYKGKRLFPADIQVPVVTISHHLAHAWSAAGSAPFNEGHIFIADGCGSPLKQCDDLHGSINLCAEDLLEKPLLFYCEKDSFYGYKNNTLLPLVKDFSPLFPDSRPYPMSPFTTLHSIGGIYSAASHYCFGNMDDAGKLMGLAPYGENGYYTGSIFRKENGRVFVDESWMKEFNNPCTGYPYFKDNFQYYANIASWVQQETEKALLYVLQHRLTYAEVSNLAYAGGCALNVLANSKIKNQFPLKQFHIVPAAGDNGLALGCAYYGWMEVLKNEKVKPGVTSCYGKTYSISAICSALTSFIDKIEVTHATDIATEAATMLDEGKVIAWFQDGAEFGPRALGNRSILSAVTRNDAKDFINREIKNREDFRPFAPAVLLEDVGTYFENDEESPYMLLVNPVKEEWKELLSNMVHLNGTSRVQTVTAANGKFHQLLTAYKKLSGKSVLLNTSFNKRGMPIVETPEDAIRFFLSCPLDVLVIGDYLITKATSSHQLFSNPVTQRIADFLVSKEIEVQAGAINEDSFLPGILIKEGMLIVDEEKLKYPGDLLHEAGHLAVMTEEDRKAKTGNIGEADAEEQSKAMGEEIMAIAWSYAACVEMGLSHEVVFHEGGYKGASDWYVEQYASGSAIGLPALQWIGLCYDHKNAKEKNSKPYPHMIKWKR